jgi:hypothetical protein
MKSRRRSEQIPPTELLSGRGRFFRLDGTKTNTVFGATETVTGRRFLIDAWVHRCSSMVIFSRA